MQTEKRWGTERRVRKRGELKREEEWKGKEMRDICNSHPSGKIAQLVRRYPSVLWPRVQSHFPYLSLLFLHIIIL